VGVDRCAARSEYRELVQKAFGVDGVNFTKAEFVSTVKVRAGL
jgi:hypothetical protein